MSSPPVAVTAGPLPPSSRYRHPGDVIRLISAGLLLAGALIASAIAFRWLLGPAASVPGGLGVAGQVITGLVQVACLAAAAVVIVATLRRRRFRLLAGLAAGAVAAAGLAYGIFALLGGERPAVLMTNQARGAWLASAAFPAPALFASAAAVVVAAAPWLSRPWRRAAWLTLLLAAAARLLAGAVLPMEVILALAAGVTVGAAVLVTFGVPDRRIGPAGIVAALRDAGLPVQSVRPAEAESKGSKKFAAVLADGRRLFVKALGSDQRLDEQPPAVRGDHRERPRALGLDRGRAAGRRTSPGPRRPPSPRWRGRGSPPSATPRRTAAARRRPAAA